MVSNTNDKKKLGKGTKSVHSGTSPSENSLNTPVYQTSTFYLDDKGYKMWMAGKPRAPVYSGRYYNPTNRAVERKIADLEGAEDALVFSSGMAAICTTLINFLGQGDRIVTTRNLYGGTVGVLDQDFVRFGIDVHYVDVRDLEAVEKKIQKYEKLSRTGDKDSRKVVDVLAKYKAHLEQGKSVRSIDLEDKEKEHINDLMLLTDKPIMYVCNVDEASIKNGNFFVDRVKENVKDEDASVLMIAASTEADITELDSYEERQMFLEDMGLDEPGVSKLIRSAYKLLNLSTYFTAGTKEVRAWAIKKGMKAPQAAGVIHTDFEKGFIRAEVIKYTDFIELGSELACKENGKMSLEGKEYIVADGDIMHFRFNT